MTKMLKRNIWRSITGSFGRYLAILLIIMLGSAFFTGLKMTRADMTGTAAAYLEETSLYDLRLMSTLGFDADDVEAVTQCDGVTAAEGAYNSDVLWADGSADLVLQVQSITDQINLPNLVAGRMPQAANECLLDAHRFSADMIGQTIRLSDNNEQDTLDMFAYREYTVVGIAESPCYLDVDRGTSTLGDGTVYAFMLIPPRALTRSTLQNSM